MPDKDQFMTHQEIIMKNNLNEVINERLKNRIEWRNYLAWLLTHKELQMQAKKEFYKDKLILNLIMKFYFLPYNTIKFLSYLSDRHKFEMIETEIRMLKGKKDVSKE